MTISKAIDPGRLGLSKSLMTNPCERKGYYSETVRDEQGRRLRFPMPERVTFGRAIDAAVTYIAWHQREGSGWTREGAIAEAHKAAREDEPSWALIDDVATFDMQVANAILLYLVQPDGLERLRPYIPGIRIQGDDGRSLSYGDVIGTPDFVTTTPDVTVIDVKTAARKYDERKFVESAEMPVYAMLVSYDFGFMPDRLAYQAYIRVGKPYWQWVETRCTAEHVQLGRLHAMRWRRGLLERNEDTFGFNTAFCGDCPFAAPLPEFAGCAVGMAVKAIGGGTGDE